MPPLTDDLTPAELTGHEDAPLERFCRGGGEGDLAAAFFGFWGRPHHTSLLRGVVDLVIDLEIAAVQVDILDREPGALPCPETVLAYSLAPVFLDFMGFLASALKCCPSI